MTVAEIMSFLESKGSESIKKILLKHGIKEPFYGVKIEFLKEIQKKVKTDYQLSKDLYATGNADAMYLAGLIADDAKMTPDDLQLWARQAVSNNISEYTVPWVATGNRYGYELALTWIDSADEQIAVIGWATLLNWVSQKPDSELDLPAFRSLLKRVVDTIHTSPNRVRSVMNSFLISLGTYVAPLSDEVIAAAQIIGDVMVDKGDTACKAPRAEEYILKAKAKGMLGTKKKIVKC